MTIFGSIAYLMTSSTLAGTTAAKAALCRIVFGIGVVTAMVSVAAVTSRLRKLAGGHGEPHTG